MRPVILLSALCVMGCSTSVAVKRAPLIQAVRDSEGARMIDLLHAPSGPLRSPEAADGGHVTLQLDTRPEHYHWLLHNDSGLHALHNVCLEGVARRDFKDPDRLVPGIATHLWVNPKYTEFRIEIDPKATWHVPAWYVGTSTERAWMKSPRPVTADDLALSLEIIRSPLPGVVHIQSLYEDLERVDVLGPRTLRVRFKRPTYAALKGLAFLAPTPLWLFGSTPDGTPVPRQEIPASLEKHWARKIPVGAGPYRVASFDASTLTLRRHDGYHGERPALDEIRFLTPKNNVSAELLSQRKIDFAPVDVYSQRRFLTGPKSAEFNARPTDTLGYYYVAWNTQDPRFEDARTRRALTMALDRKRLVEHVFQGLAHIHDSPFAFGAQENAPGLKPWPFDPKRAQTLLDEAGWIGRDPDGVRYKEVGGKKVRLEFEITTFDNHLYRIEYWRWELERLGVKLRWKPKRWPEMKRALRDQTYDVVLGGWSLAWDTDPYQLWHSSQVGRKGSSNRSRFANVKADTLLEKLRVTFQRSKRVELLRAFHRIVYEEQPYTFLYATRELFVWDPRVQNVVFSPARPYYSPRTWFINFKKPPVAK